ncbi:hypothetical protein DPMN_152406 [Dreissena polymorpha]|uniref:Uncharacterized protein n=2 Tax=Dreissena polymorpha TaxID=45954 RepID=A0A9D4FH67_DREPO|nr:hypothetical protein DPMN_152406 [Dreissena polymorpha]
MRYMNADNFTENVSVLTIDLSDNQFRQIPSGLNTFKNLTSLTLDHNVIEFIEDNDLIGLRSLKEIHLAGNPIQSITPRAFHNNMKLTYVDVSQTFLTSIPAAVTTLPSLHTLRLEANAIKCTCGLARFGMNWGWNASSIQIDRLCYQSSAPIALFIKTNSRCST